MIRTSSTSLTQRMIGASFWRNGFSSLAKDELVQIDMDESTQVATLTMQNPPVNSLSLEMLQALSSSIKAVESNPGMKAMILQSANPSIFSAGLDIMEMHNPDKDRLERFWKSFQQVYLDLYGSKLPCVASLQGTAPAAGCMLALSCDYRILVNHPKTKIGLNETQLGIVAPAWLSQQLVDTIGHRQAELSLGLGTLYNPSEARDIGLVDEVIGSDDEDVKKSREKVQQRCMEIALQFSKIPSQAWLATKLQVRGKAINEMRALQQHDLDQFVGFVTQDETQASLSAYLKALSQRKAKEKQ